MEAFHLREVNNMKIQQCRSCKSEDLKDILSLGEQYLSEFRKDDIKPAKYPLDLVLCENCFLLQLKHTVPQSALYNEGYGYKSGINNTIRADLKEIVLCSLATADLKEGDAVLDIGANDGTLLSNYAKDIYRVGCEPIKKLALECSQHTNAVVNDFFNYQAISRTVPDKKFKIITAISCFYDLDDPNAFVQDVGDLLDEDGIFVVQQNYLVGMLLQNAFDNIVHEHLEYFSLWSLEKLLDRHKMEVFHVQLNDINGGSFRTFIGKKGQRPIDKSVLALRKTEKDLRLDKPEVYERFAGKVEEIGADLHAFVSQVVDEGKIVYVYGASTRGNTLLQFANLDNRLVKAAVERNPEKWGTKIASVGIPIISEEQARKDKPSFMLVLPWFFKAEFLKREKEYLDNGGSFIIPLPELEII